jgi:adenylate cyclase class 2
VPEKAGRPLEVEAKAKADNLLLVEGRLAGLGAVLETNKVERDEYWAHPARDFGETDEALRLRIITADDGGGWSRAELTYKGAKVDSTTKTRPEETLSIDVDQVDGLRRVLEGLGFRPFARVTKDRREFLLEGLTICLDRVEGVGSYVEIELISDDLEAARRRVLGLFERLELDPCERRSYLELLLRAQKPH